ncbi:glutamine amidotransferase [Roseomonas indoligenes]|uniref:Glutamine amidotransferase n=1 Tax=Roseomonas indoligenes TaxID=2820811 RepID=A0A940N340_9PROT|nr:glutamine amidotransferase [Pararoseomonas indoligenes]MBP0495136.1 glutamine amidotransferase [Pararoseomonas indoligenes]
MIGVARVIRHVGFEDLGTFDEPLRAAGYFIHYHDAGRDSLAAIDPLGDDLLVVLGGPVGAYEVDAYPFLAEEIALLRRRLALLRPTLGVCLGAQLMAAALGARVEPGRAKEIGFAPLDLTPAGAVGPLRHLEGVAVLHWHGDAFAIPGGAEGLATTPACATQGFARGPNVLGLQFHPEFDASAGIEPWLIGHATELAGAGIDPRGLRAKAARCGAALRGPARAMLTEWLAELR